MERRRDTRVTSEQPVRVTVLRRDRQQMHGTALDLSGRGIRLLLPLRLPPGAAVKIETEDGLLLGEICYCQPEGDSFVAGVQLDQALNGLGELARLNRGLFEPMPEFVDARYPTRK